MSIAPGTQVSVEIVSTPTNAAARKTLTRIARKDAGVAKRERTRKEKRPSLQVWRRGGRPWEHRMRTQPAISLETGRSYSVRATVDVLRDLASVEKFIKVAPSK
jgi:hypothetical protein